MSDWAARLREEFNQITERLAKLRAFMLTQQYAEMSAIDRVDLEEQADHMHAYCAVLKRRIARIPENT